MHVKTIAVLSDDVADILHGSIMHLAYILLYQVGPKSLQWGMRNNCAVRSLHLKQVLYKLLFSRGFYFSRISRARPSRKFPLQFMSIYSNDNIRKIAKLTTRELPHLVQKRENNCTRK